MSDTRGEALIRNVDLLKRPQSVSIDEEQFAVIEQLKATNNLRYVSDVFKLALHLMTDVSSANVGEPSVFGGRKFSNAPSKLDTHTPYRLMDLTAIMITSRYEMMISVNKFPPISHLCTEMAQSLRLDHRLDDHLAYVESDPDWKEFNDLAVDAWRRKHHDLMIPFIDLFRAYEAFLQLRSTKAAKRMGERCDEAMAEASLSMILMDIIFAMAGRFSSAIDSWND